MGSDLSFGGNSEGNFDRNFDGNYEQDSTLSDAFVQIAESINTPAFIYEEEYISHRCQHLRHIADEAGCKLLYTLKALTLPGVLKIIAPYVHGFSASSLFESIIARDGLPAGGSVHLTSPGLRPDEIERISGLCDYLSFNSISQWLRHKSDVAEKVKVGLRVNPQMSFLEDSRYDPCRPHSKLGASIGQVREALEREPHLQHGLSGILIHNNCNAPDFRELLLTVQKVETELGFLLHSLEWINLGGGYLFDRESSNIEALYEAVWSLKSKYGLEVFIEPGSAFVREAGFLVSTVLDLIETDGKEIAILDTSVNHVPEAFEYQWRPEVLRDVEDGEFSYVLAGSTCLAGDVFGEYSFTQPLEINSKVIITGVGAYNLVKAHTFNGLTLPSIYSLKARRDVELVKEFTSEEHFQRWGFENNVSVGD